MESYARQFNYATIQKVLLAHLQHQAVIALHRYLILNATVQRLIIGMVLLVSRESPKVIVVAQIICVNFKN